MAYGLNMAWSSGGEPEVEIAGGGAGGRRVSHASRASSLKMTSRKGSTRDAQMEREGESDRWFECCCCWEKDWWCCCCCIWAG